ncbi:MAG: hypothetical protein DRP01_02210 [Archaeoglobales archaeon]|nr:MAG: hypothetical protein DRP01_02210 [Archaeoglobales archaeon]
MPVRIKEKVRSQGSVTPPLDTETDIINLADQSDDYIIEGQIDLSNMASGDKVTIKVYIAVDGTNQRLSDQITFSGAQTIPVVRIMAHTIPYNGKFRVTITQTEGTSRSFPYTFIYQIMETI